MKPTLLTVLTVLVSFATAIPPIPDHGVCSNKLYQGMVRSVKAGERLNDVIRQNPEVSQHLF